MTSSSNDYGPLREVSHITQREKEILSLLCDGYSSKEIGSKLFISPHTVESHKRNLMTKYAARNTVHLAVMVERQGLNNKSMIAPEHQYEKSILLV